MIAKVLDQDGNGSVEKVQEAINWVLDEKEHANIRLLNISIGMYPQVGKQEQQQLLEAVERAWDHGIVVIVAAGNKGPGERSVTYPGISRKVITVGSVREKMSQKYYSGRGPTTDCVIKPEILAPGQSIVSCNNEKTGYTVKSGSSMATAVVTGALCLLLKQEPQLTPVQVKMRLYDTARDLGLSKKWQGWGMIDMTRLLQCPNSVF